MRLATDIFAPGALFFRLLRQAAPLFFILSLLFVATPRLACAWPLDSQWLVLTDNGQAVSDTETDKNGAVNIVGNSIYPAAYTFNDGAYLYFPCASTPRR